MLYIFHVDTGATHTFDIKLALQSVAELKEAIERRCGILADHQVLLMNGGECLEPDARVCSYSAGTDTNPIYLFSKEAIESHIPPIPHTDYSHGDPLKATAEQVPDASLIERINASLGMSATYRTLVTRAEIAQQCYELAREQTSACDHLVHDQHFQHQGWAAVVANLDDITYMFKERADNVRQAFTIYMTEREQHMELVNNFTADLGILSKIPILPALRAQAEGLFIPDDQAAAAAAAAAAAGQELQLQVAECADSEVYSLLSWIAAKDNQASLEQVADQCSRGLEQFDERLVEMLMGEVSQALESGDKPEMKEIKGLGERLSALEQLMNQAKRLVQEQGELAQGFLQNQTRANNLGDPSILPDLCASHRHQLLVMMENHTQIRDIRRRCIKAKEELSFNIYHRLKWIMYIENKMIEIDGRLVMYHESLKRLRRHLDIIRQIHLAPQMYMTAVAEVVRRRTFSQAFLAWANNLACQLLAVHSEEIDRRREFQSKFNGHFLYTLFSGLDDIPPPFATQAPAIFDSRLPKLTVHDMESLKDQLPDLADSLSTPDLNSITQFFLSKSLSADDTKEKEDNSISMPVDIPNKERTEPLPMIADRVGFESETDTEEFEKIGQAGGDSKLGSYDGTKQKLLRKQLEVGGDDDGSRSVSPSSSTSTNVSSLTSRVVDLNRSSSSSSEPGAGPFHFPSFSASERPVPLSPLAECAENAENSSGILGGNRHNRGVTSSSCCVAATSYSRDIADRTRRSSSTSDEARSLSPLPTYHSRSVACDGQLQQQLQQPHQQQQQQQLQHRQQQQAAGSGGSSPSAEPGTADFLGTEFYMDESLPSSLSEHPNDGQHQAIVSLLQENLGNTRNEVEGLRSILRNMKIATGDSITSFRDELSMLRKKVKIDTADLKGVSDRVQHMLAVHSQKCEDALREREQQLKVSHESEMKDIKELLHNRDEEVCNMYSVMRDVETQLADREYMVNTMRQKIEDERAEMRDLRTRMRNDLEEALERARIERETAVKETNEARQSEIEALETNLAQCRQTITELEEAMKNSKAEQQRAVKEATDKIQMEYKSELDTIRARFKMVASSLERSPSDSSLEKIERPDVIERVSHEAILAQVRAEMKCEQERAVCEAIKKENCEFEAKLEYRLQQAALKMNEETDAHRMREGVLVEECQQYQDIIRRLTEDDVSARKILTDTVEKLEEEKQRLEMKMLAEKKVVKQRELQIAELQAEQKRWRHRISENLLNPASPPLSETLHKLLSDSKEDIAVSESKKVRLEASTSHESLAGRLELLELDNQRLTAELRAIRDSKETVEAKVEALEADKVRLEVELVKERSKRSVVILSECENYGSASLTSTSDLREMNTSVAVVSESTSQDMCSESGGGGAGSGGVRCALVSHYRHLIAKYFHPLVEVRNVCFTSCNPGDIVFVDWDASHSHYVIIQACRIQYILNSECIDSIELSPNPDGTPKALHILSRVLDKQYCHAKKPQNRYHVPQGTKFYRVRVKPLAYVS